MTIINQGNYHKKAEDTIRRWMMAFCKRKYNSDFSKEMSRSVHKYLEQYAEGEE